MARAIGADCDLSNKIRASVSPGYASLFAALQSVYVMEVIDPITAARNEHELPH